MTRILPLSLPLVAFLSYAPCASHAQDLDVAAVTAVSAAACSGLDHMTYLQRRIVAKAAQGITPLRLYVWNTRAIYQLDLRETVAWLDQRRALSEACQSRVARVDSIAAAQ